MGPCISFTAGGAALLFQRKPHNVGLYQLGTQTEMPSFGKTCCTGNDRAFAVARETGLFAFYGCRSRAYVVGGESVARS